jgi:hypothetical protein
VLLDGSNNGVAGSNYNGSITWNNVMWTPAEAKKYDQPAQARKYDHPPHAKPAGSHIHRFVRKAH